MKTLFFVTFSIFTSVLFSEATDNWFFDFSTNPNERATQVHCDNIYASECGYGFEWIGQSETSEKGIKAKEPFIFSVHTGEGNFEVTATFADTPSLGSITVKAESRRLMVNDTTLPQSKTHEYQFIVNVRNAKLQDGSEVSLNQREIGAWHWDDRLQLEINGDNPTLRSISIKRIKDIPTLFITGDSTVTDQTAEPWIGWGQMLPYFLKSTIVVANHAESGETLRAFRNEFRLQKILEEINEGDFLILQFGHNDMKEKGEGIGAMTSYADDLRDYIGKVREKRACPILVTSMKRRRFDDQGRQYATLKDYPLAVRRVAAEMQVPLIDLNYMSGVFYAALGPKDSTRAFVHYPAGTFEGQTKALKDDSHFNAYGGYELARCVVEGIHSYVPELRKHLKENISDFDPANPDKPESIQIPASPISSIYKPAGD